MNAERAKALYPYIDKKLGIENIESNNHELAIIVLKRCVLGELMAKAYIFREGLELCQSTAADTKQLKLL